MNDNLRFHRPKLRGDVTIIETSDGARVSRLGGRRFVEFEFERERHAELCQFLMALADFGIPRQELSGAFPGSLEELEQLVEALDEQGMLDEGDERTPSGVSGVAAYGYLRRYADAVRRRLHSPFYEALIDGTAQREHLIGYAVEYWHITHLCPRALSPVLARDDLPAQTWQKLMSFYQVERNHDRMLEKSLVHVGITREQLLRVQPLPATAAIMASLGVYAYQCPLALIATLFPMEEPELDFLGHFRRRAIELRLPGEFVNPIVAHSDVNENEAHDVVSLDMLEDVDFIGAEELRECAKAVADIIEQRARLDAEIWAWWPEGGLRDFTHSTYESAGSRRLSCAHATLWV